MTIDIQSADEYFSSRYGAEIWLELDNTQKQAALITAYNNIKKLPFIGQKLSETQTDLFPRIYKGQAVQMPADVENAIYEEAFSIISRNELNINEIPDGVQSLSLGSASISFKDTQNINPISKTAIKFLDGWLQKGFDIEPEKFREVY